MWYIYTQQLSSSPYISPLSLYILPSRNIWIHVWSLNQLGSSTPEHKLYWCSTGLKMKLLSIYCRIPCSLFLLYSNGVAVWVKGTPYVSSLSRVIYKYYMLQKYSFLPLLLVNLCSYICVKFLRKYCALIRRIEKKNWYKFWFTISKNSSFLKVSTNLQIFMKIVCSA